MKVNEGLSSKFDITEDYEIDLRGFFKVEQTCPSEKYALTFLADTLIVETSLMKVPYEAGTSKEVIVTASLKTKSLTASTTLVFES